MCFCFVIFNREKKLTDKKSYLSFVHFTIQITASRTHVQLHNEHTLRAMWSLRMKSIGLLQSVFQIYVDVVGVTSLGMISFIFVTFLGV